MARFGFWLYSRYDKINKLLVFLTDVMVFGYRTYRINIVCLIGCLLMLGPHVNCFLFAMNNPKTEYWSLQVAKCEIIITVII